MEGKEKKMTQKVEIEEGSMDEKVKKFKSDPQLMDATTKFVNEVVEKANKEAQKRMKEREKLEKRNSGREKRGGWHSRARGFFTRMFSSLCFCNMETKV